MSITPYTKDKLARQSIEQLAETFCRQKRQGLETLLPVKLPDFIFTTDGCSRWPDNGWLSCCIVHDIAYWCGGSEQDRKEADMGLRQCVDKKTSFMGDVMYSGVRLGGMPWLPTPWRWGYGWDSWPKGYERLGPLPSTKKLMETLKVQDVVERQLLPHAE